MTAKKKGKGGTPTTQETSPAPGTKRCVWSPSLPCVSCETSDGVNKNGTHVQICHLGTNLACVWLGIFFCFFFNRVY